MPERTLTTILRTARIDSVHGYEVFAAVRAVLSWATAKAEKLDTDAKRDRDRKGKAEADIAEMERGRAIKTLCSRDDYKNNYADGIAQGVRNIGRIKGLTKAQKDLVFAAIRDVKLAEPEEEK